MSGEQPSYSDVRRQREAAQKEYEETGGVYLSATKFPNGLDVTVTGTEVRPDNKFGKGPQPYWQVTAQGVDGTKLVKENGSMSDRLHELGIAYPTGKSFILGTAGEVGKKYWTIVRAL
jgi:hypothetical protein